MASMSLDDLRQLLSRWPDLLVVAMVIGPIIWAILNATYRNRLEAMREDIDRLRARLGDELTALKRVTVESVSTPLVVQEPRTEAGTSVELVERSVPDALSGPKALRKSVTLEFGKYDPEGYPKWMSVSPPVPPEDRSYLPPRAGKEIQEAMQALPPLSRDAAAINAYVGKWVRSRGTIVSVNERQDTLSVFVNAEDGNYFLDFPTAKRSLVESLREKQRIQFEGQIVSVGNGHVSLVHVSLVVEDEGAGPTPAT